MSDLFKKLEKPEELSLLDILQTLVLEERLLYCGACEAEIEWKDDSSSGHHFTTFGYCKTCHSELIPDPNVVAVLRIAEGKILLDQVRVSKYESDKHIRQTLFPTEEVTYGPKLKKPIQGLI